AKSSFFDSLAALGVQGADGPRLELATFSYKFAPRQWSLTRRVSKNELPSRCINRTVRRLRLTVISSPAPNSVTNSPSALRSVAGFGVTTFTEISAVRGRTSERMDTVWAQMGVS